MTQILADTDSTTKKSRYKPAKRKKNLSWFVPRGHVAKSNLVSAVKVEINTRGAAKRPLVVSIPALCGNAVKRNRLRRIFRESMKEIMAEKSDAKALETVANKSGHQILSEKKSGDGIWVRVNRNLKLERKIGKKHWKMRLQALLDEII